MRRVIGNWKQHLLRPAAAELAADVARRILEVHDVEVGIAPGFLALDALAPWCGPGQPLRLYAQDCAAQDEGPFTGEVGPAMLREIGVVGALVGHSERRALFHEGGDLVTRKVLHALRSGLEVILCVGEPLEVRDAGEHESFVISQLSSTLANLSPELLPGLSVAYEPVWAIGTGRTASPAQAADMHGRIRGFLADRFGAVGADRSILYGGSVRADNAAALLAAGGIDGFLVGGASLDPAAFAAIVSSAHAPC